MPASIFLSHSSASDPMVGSLLDRLSVELAGREFEVMFDKKRLGGGTEWRPVLHRWLGECDGAVIVFSPTALESDWVLKESTILTWRKSLGSRVRVLPVLVGCRREEVVEHRAFKPLDLGNLQFLQLDQTLPPEQAVEILLQKLLGELAGLQPDASDKPLREWIRNVELLLDKVDPVDYLEDAAASLGIAADARSLFPDLSKTVAHQLLHVGLSHTHKAFKSLRKGLDRERFERLMGLVVPTWVRLEAAAHVHAVLDRSPGRRRLAVNSEFPITGEHYLVRATCGEAELGHMVTVSGVVGADDELELLSAYEQALWKAVRRRPQEPFRREVLQKALSFTDAPIYILLPAQAARPILVPDGATPSLLARDLLGGYQHATFVFLIRDPALWAAAESIPGIERIVPELLEEDEDDALGGRCSPTGCRCSAR